MSFAILTVMFPACLVFPLASCDLLLPLFICHFLIGLLFVTETIALLSSFGDFSLEILCEVMINLHIYVINAIILFSIDRPTYKLIYKND